MKKKKKTWSFVLMEWRDNWILSWNLFYVLQVVLSLIYLKLIFLPPPPKMGRGRGIFFFKKKHLFRINSIKIFFWHSIKALWWERPEGTIIVDNRYSFFFFFLSESRRGFDFIFFHHQKKKKKPSTSNFCFALTYITKRSQPNPKRKNNGIRNL